MPDDAMTPDPRFCNAKTRGGGRCRRPAGWGTPHAGSGSCKLHAGCVPNAIKHALRTAAAREISALGLQLDVEPDEALLVLVRMAAANVAYLGSLVGILEPTLLAADAEERLYGPNHLGDAAPHVLVGMYGDWCDRLGRYAKAASDAGVAQRRVELAEDQGRLVADVIRRILADLDLTDEQQQMVPTVAHRHLTALAATSTPSAA